MLSIVILNVNILRVAYNTFMQRVIVLNVSILSDVALHIFLRKLMIIFSLNRRHMCALKKSSSQLKNMVQRR